MNIDNLPEDLSELSREELLELLHAVRDAQAAIRPMKLAMSLAVSDTIQSLAGVYYQEMTSDTSCLMDFVHHEEADVREAALMLLDTMEERKNERFLLLLQVIREDRAEGPRSCAIRSLSHFREAVYTSEAGDALAEIVLNETESSFFRLAAYTALINLRNLLPTWSPHPLRLRFPEDIDWMFVDSFLQHHRK